MLDFLILGTLALGVLALAANILTDPHRAHRAQPARARRESAVPSGSSRGMLRLTEDQWKARLTPEQYRVARQGGAERPFTGAWWDHHEDGAYVCVACGLELFRSEDKYDAGTGWPSFTRPARPDAVGEHKDIGDGKVRTEVVCSGCESHLGHVFPDGPRPGGRRYGVNSAALDFRPAQASPLMVRAAPAAGAGEGAAGAS